MKMKKSKYKIGGIVSFILACVCSTLGGYSNPSKLSMILFGGTLILLFISIYFYFLHRKSDSLYKE